MRAGLVLAMVLLQAGTQAGEDSPARHLRVQRAVQVVPGSSGQTCAVLDADVFAHAENESLNDVRLFTAAGAETPFTLTESNTVRAESEAAVVRNLGLEQAAGSEEIVFDLEMPKRPYTAVDLTLDAKNFVGSAKVAGHDEQGRNVALGDFAIFDLSGQHLSRSTTLALQESSFTVLHVQLRLHPAPGTGQQRFASNIVAGATVPPSRVAQTLYTTVAETGTWTQRGHDSVATVRLPAHVPVARVQMVLDPAYKANFLRDVTISAKPDQVEDADSPASAVESVSGEISQVHLASAAGGRGASGVAIDNRQMIVDAVLAANLRGGATVEVAVANGDDVPLPLRSVQMQMRQRRICFDTSAQASGYTLMYGDKKLAAPVYDYSRLFAPSATPGQATLGPEQPNSQFVERADARPFTERHPDLLWLGMLGALAALGGVALRSMRRQRGEGS